MQLDLAGQRGLVTGASSGIGTDFVRELAARGMHLAISARRRDLLEQLADEIARTGGVRPIVLPADLSQRGAAADLAARAHESLGQVDVLVNNAGVGCGGSQWCVGDRDEAREIFEVNVWSPAALVQGLVPAMRERRHGAVVNVTSIAQVTTIGLLGHYTASKAAMAQLTETLNLELDGSGVHVLQVIPGPTKTAVMAEMTLIPGAERAFRHVPMATPAQVAAAAVKALERGRSRVVRPRAAALVYAMPFLARLNGRRLARMVDSGDDRVIRAGAFGDPIVREARESWQNAQLRE